MQTLHTLHCAEHNRANRNAKQIQLPAVHN